MTRNFNYLKTNFLFALFLSLIASVKAQDLRIKHIDLENENVILYYDLVDTTRGRLYAINVYSSRDNYISPLQHLKGDFGIEVQPGSNRKIEVNIKEEYGPTFDGKLAFEIRAKVYIPFITMEGFNASRKFKKGKVYEIHWTGGRPQNILNFDLYRGENKINSFYNIPNAGKYNLIFPKDTKPGRNYKFRVSDSKNKDEVVNTAPFTITRKVPLVFIIAPAAAVGGALYFVFKPKPACQGCLVDFPNAPIN